MLGLITIYDLNNYGNRLQNYALSSVLIQYSKNVVSLPDVPRWYAGKLLPMVKHYVGSFLHLLGVRKSMRYRSFLMFTIKNIPTITFIDPSKVKTKKYVVGSDQVWNPYFKHLSNYDTLEFLKDKRAKGIAYAASFGVDDLTEDYAPRLQQIANNFSFISVREESGKKLLEKFTDRKDVQVLVDPTLLLTPKEWDKVARKPKHFGNERYVFLYFLGAISDVRREIIESFAKENGLRIVELMNRESEFYSYGPSEFLWCISHAECVLTDSYHGSIFSFLFNKPFLVYDREDHTKDMSTRLDTLLSTFGLQDRKYPGVLSPQLLEHDYSEGYEVLETERRKSYVFLDKALSDS